MVHHNTSPKLPEEQRKLITPEAEQVLGDVVRSMVAFVAAEGQASSPQMVVQQEAYTDIEEADRDEFLRQLGVAFGRNIDQELTDAETVWREEFDTKYAHGHKYPDTDRVVRLEPFMYGAFGLEEPSDGNHWAKGTQRDILLDTTNGTDYRLRELEIENRVIEADGERLRHQRIFWLYTTPAEPTT